MNIAESCETSNVISPSLAYKNKVIQCGDYAIYIYMYECQLQVNIIALSIMKKQGRQMVLWQHMHVVACPQQHNYVTANVIL